MGDSSMYSTSVSPVVEYFKTHPLPHQGAPMLYQALDGLDRSRLPDVIEGVSCREDMFCEELPRDVRINTHITKEQEHNADVMLGLVFMMVGGVDEAHDLVLPYSWPCETIWGGAPVLNSPALSSATHCHALVHRMEGKHPGEGGMRGWDNAHYWFGQVPTKHPLEKQFLKACEDIEIEQNLSDEARQQCARVKGNSRWSWYSLTDLCSQSNHSSEVSNFCDKVHNLEIAMLFNHCNTAVNPSV